MVTFSSGEKVVDEVPATIPAANTSASSSFAQAGTSVKLDAG